MANKTDNTPHTNLDEKTHEVPDQPLDNGYSEPTDTRVDQYADVKLNAPGADFSHLEDTDAANPDKPLDNTPAGVALGHSDGRPMTQREEFDPVTQEETKDISQRGK